MHRARDVSVVDVIRAVTVTAIFDCRVYFVGRVLGVL